MQNPKKTRRIAFNPVALVLLLALAATLMPYQKAFAGELENEKDIMTRQSDATLSSHTISFALSGTNTFAAGESFTIDFNEDGSKFVVDGASSAIADFGFNDGTERTIVGVDGNCATHTDVNDVAVGINDTTGVVTFTACSGYTASAGGAVVTVEYGTAAGGTNRVTNPSQQNDLYIPIVVSDGDTGGFSVSIVDDDQVVVTATVNPLFTFVLEQNTCVLGTLGTGGVSTCDYDISTTTNSEDGYATTIIEDGNLRNGSNTIDDVGDGTVTAGDEEYGIGLTGTNKAFADDRAITGTAQTVASVGSGPVTSDTVTITHKASIDVATVAGEYAHTVTLISTGTF